MLEALVPAAALLTNNSIANSKPELDCNSNPTVAHLQDLTQPISDSSPFIVDGGTRP